MAVEAKSFFSDLKETMNDRLRNPFIFSFICSWVAWNWMLLYQVATFDSDCTLGTRTSIIANYVAKHHWDNLTFKPLGWSFLLALAYLVCSALFTIIFSWYNTSFKAWINKITLIGENVTMQHFKALERKYDSLKQKSDRYITENLELNETINKSRDEFVQSSERTISLVKENSDLKKIDAKNTESLKKLRTANVAFRLFKTDNILDITKIFLDKRKYILTIENKENHPLPNYFNTPLTLLFEKDRKSNNMYAFNVGDGSAMFQITSIQITDDGNLVQFIMHNQNSNTATLFYLFKRGQFKFSGMAIMNNTDYRAEFLLKEEN